MGSRFVRPDTTVLKISNGDTLTVKRRLSSGEQRAAFARMYLANVDGTLRVNPLSTGVARITAFLLDWSLTDDDGRPVVIRGTSADELTAILDNLDPESFMEINTAIEKHEEAIAQERADAKKKAMTTGDGSTSPSPSDVTGGSNGSGLLTSTITAYS